LRASKDWLHGARTTTELQLINRQGQRFNYFAVGSSGKLVERSWARICGVVIGTSTYFRKNA
jgi:hypothetical protein